jgi:hypothetical protein
VRNRNRRRFTCRRAIRERYDTRLDAPQSDFHGEANMSERYDDASYPSVIHTPNLARRPPSARLASVRTGAIAVGALAMAALAIGALAIGALAIGRLAIGRSRIGRLEIDELLVRRWRVLGAPDVPPASDRGQ